MIVEVLKEFIDGIKKYAVGIALIAITLALCSTDGPIKDKLESSIGTMVSNMLSKAGI